MEEGRRGSGARTQMQRWEDAQVTDARWTDQSVAPLQHAPRRKRGHRPSCCAHCGCGVVGICFVDDGDVWAPTKPHPQPCGTTRRRRHRAVARRSEEAEEPVAWTSLGDGMETHDDYDRLSMEGDVWKGGVWKGGCRSDGVVHCTASHTSPRTNSRIRADDARSDIPATPFCAHTGNPACTCGAEGMCDVEVSSGTAAVNNTGAKAVVSAPRSGGGRGRPPRRVLRQGQPLGSRRRARGPGERSCRQGHGGPRGVRGRGECTSSTGSGDSAVKHNHFFDLRFIGAARVIGHCRRRWPRKGARCARGIVVIRVQQREADGGCRCKSSMDMLFGDSWAPSGKPLLRYGEATIPGPDMSQQ